MPLFSMPDGRNLEYEVYGTGPGPVVAFHHGMPGSAVPMATVLDSIVDRGFRVVTHARAGYAASSPAPGRTVADAAADSVSLLAHLGVDRYLAVGWSAGGPPALASAVIAPEHVAGVLVIASFAPYDAHDLAFTAGMGTQNIAQFDVVGKSESAMREFVGQMASGIRGRDAADVALSMASLLPEVDATILTGPFGADNAANMNRALSSGDEGWVADLVALTSPWGVDVSTTLVPVELWHGADDRMAPSSHGQWLAEHLPAVVAHLETGHGHLSLAVGSLGAKLDALPDVDPRHHGE